MKRAIALLILVSAVCYGQDVPQNIDNWSDTYRKAQDAEPGLGNPGVDDYVLSSKTDGTRSWVENAGGGGGTSLTNSAGAEITVATTNETSTSETEVMTAGAVARLNASDIAAANTPTTVGDVLRVSETGADGRKTMRYRTRALFHGDLNNVNQSLLNDTWTAVILRTNNVVNLGGYFEKWDYTYTTLRDGSAPTGAAEATGATFNSLKYVGTSGLWVNMLGQVFVGQIGDKTMLNVTVNNNIVLQGGDVDGGSQNIVNSTKWMQLTNGDVISLLARHRTGSTRDLLGAIGLTFFQIVEH